MILPFAQNLEEKNAEKNDFLILTSYELKTKRKRKIKGKEIIIQDYLILSPIKPSGKNNVLNSVNSEILKN